MGNHWCVQAAIGGSDDDGGFCTHAAAFRARSSLEFFRGEIIHAAMWIGCCSTSVERVLDRDDTETEREGRNVTNAICTGSAGKRTINLKR